jgi:hypothetical protein
MTEQNFPAGIDPGMELYAGGMPYVGTRELTAEEHQELKLIRRRVRMQCWGRWLAIPLVYFSLLALAGTISDALDYNSSLHIIPTILVLLATFGVLPVLFLRTQDIGQAGKLLKQSVVSPRLYIFRRDAFPGAVEGYVEVIAGVAAPLNRASDFEVFAASQLIWSVDGQRVRDYQPLYFQKTAARPAQAIPPAPVLSTTGDASSLQNTVRRQLSPDEKQEIRRLGWQMLRTPLLMGLGIDILGFGSVTACLMVGFTIQWSYKLISFLLVGLFLNAVLAVCVGLYRKLRVDARDGYALVHTGPNGAVTETLPNFNYRWIEDGRPAGWRLVPGG